MKKETVAVHECKINSHVGEVKGSSKSRELFLVEGVFLSPGRPWGGWVALMKDSLRAGEKVEVVRTTDRSTVGRPVTTPVSVRKDGRVQVDILSTPSAEVRRLLEYQNEYDEGEDANFFGW